jgi:hypothetical protein
VIPVSDDVIRDKIIRATNNQNPMKQAALRATDDIHRDIEDLFKKYGLYYDRRPGFYKDQGVQIRSIVSLIEIVQATASIILHRPDDARARPGDYIREGSKGEEKYKLIFGPPRSPARIPIGAHLKCVQIVRSVEDFLQDRQQLSRTDRRNLGFYVAFFVSCDLSQTAKPTAADVLKIESGMVTNGRLEHAFTQVHKTYAELSTKEENPDTVVKGPELLRSLSEMLTRTYGPGTSDRRGAVKTRPKKIRDVIKDAEIR